MTDDDRYTLMFDEHTFFVFDNVKEERMTALETTKKLNEQQATIKKQDIEIQSLNLHIKKLVDGDEISQLLMREYEISDGLEKENKELKKQLNKKNTMNMQLREINKELGDDLYNCRLKKEELREDIHKWTRGRYVLMFDEHTFFVFDNVKDERMCALNVTERLNMQQATIEELRLQEKEKGVPVFVVRDGKNPIALFFNEQRASWFCQENMANLTYQQEKWCRVE